ncbi:MAG: PP2C family protein-serine/threonine phosphatase [Gammaproteobacteria bacterium]
MAISSESPPAGNDGSSDPFLLARHHPLLETIPPDSLRELFEQCVVLNFAKNELALRAGQANGMLFLVLSGQLHAVLNPEQDARVAIGTGECFGEMSVIEGKPVSASVIADEGACVLAVPEPVLWSTIAAIDGVARRLLRTLSERMRVRSDLIVQGIQERLEYESVQRELRLAQEVQLSMLADGNALLADHPGVDAVAAMAPAQIVGGDFFDAFAVDRARVFLAVGDVAGKGISAALFMARSLATLRLAVVSGQPHATLLARFNDAMCEHNAHSTFVTLFAGFLDTRHGALTYFSAGHHAALVVTNDGRVISLPRPNGMVAGAIEGAAYELAHYRLAVGEILVAFSDGVTEAQNTAEEFYGEARLSETLRAARPTTATAALCAVQESLATFTAGAAQFDDITLLAVRYCATPDHRTVRMVRQSATLLRRGGRRRQAHLPQ